MISTTNLQRENHRRSADPVKKTATTILLTLIAAYFLLPLYWLLVSTTKTTQQLFNTPMLLFPSHWNLLSNWHWLNSYQHGVFWRWAINSVTYSLAAAVLGTLISAMAGYVLSMYKFKGNKAISTSILGALMVPAAALAIPTFLLVKSIGLINTYPGVILPMLLNPFGVYFMTVYIREAMPAELLDSGRVDGANDYWIFFRIGLPIINPGLVTLFLISFIGTWNNFFLPLVLLSKSQLYPLTVGLSIWVGNLNTAGTGMPLYPLIMIASFLSVIPMLILFGVLRKYITSGITMGSVKS
ncbi:carbohydrate ABC transporter permease [Alicyclobacillus ferrooxydans]|uniref:ABC transmembrane type-1 domain-containing protein n=1 Tax=Alicyclobacillus ferrooxydans TaxID=471514 RepID=A0A0P9CLV4_9BACL|nr:carbohydrate ABC transporter permease [Alicyclobacillus ferrooxydans]KPV43968.1 hypothetical protein AN477_09625 [Alicyclobacillus ferrooxydans]